MSSLLPGDSRILLVTMEYPPGALEGPPFSVTDEEVHTLFGADFAIKLKASWEGAEGPRGINVTERIHTLTRR